MIDIFKRLLKLYFEDALSLLKVQAVGCYVKAVGAARKVFIAHIGLKCLLLLMLSGFVMMHIGVFAALPCGWDCKGIWLAVLGAVYFLISLIFVMRLCSQKFWMRYSKASELVKEAASKK